MIEGYDYHGKDREDVTGELVERAIDLGYLSSGETVSITGHQRPTPTGRPGRNSAAREDLEERYGETIVIQIGPAPEQPPVTEVVVPVTPPTPEPTPGACARTIPGACAGTNPGAIS